MATFQSQLTFSDTFSKLELETKQPTEMFCLDLEKVKEILRQSRTRNYISQLDTPSNVTKFRDTLTLELGDLLSDAVEIAFYRSFPSLLEQLRHDSPDNENEDESHEFDSKGCCDACSDYWWGHHDLNDCLDENEVSNCIKHENHDGESCNWSDNCPIHEEHNLSDCNDTCSTIHHHDEWHTAVDDGDMDQSHHDNNFRDCDYFNKEEESAEESAEEAEYPVAA